MSGFSAKAVKDEVVAELRKESGKYCLKSNVKGRAQIWKSFSYVIVKDTGKKFVTGENDIYNCVACNACLTVHLYKAANGTAALTKHSCPKMTTNQSLTALVTRCDPNPWEKKSITGALADMCAVDMRPFDIVKGKGFREFSQKLLNIGVNSKRGISIDKLFPAPITVSRNIERRSKSGRDVLTAVLVQHLDDGIGIGSTTDIWTDDVNKVSFLSVTAQFIDKEFVLHNRTLACQPFPMPHKGPDVLEKYQEVLSSFKLHHPDLVTVVTDRGSNMHSRDSIPSVFYWEPCCDHIIGTILTTVINKRTRTVDGKKSAPFYEFEEKAPELFTLIDIVKALVTYVKQAALEKDLETTVKQEVVTRWNSLLRCLKSVEKVLDELIELLRSRGRGLASKATLIDRDLLKELITFLEPFQEATLALEVFKQPTLHRVLYFRQSLLTHCEVVREDIAVKNKDGTVTILRQDSPSIASLKPKFRELIEEKFPITELMIVAALLNPKTKHRLHKFGVGESNLARGKVILEQKMKEHFIGDSICETGRSPKRRKQSESFFRTRRLAENSSDDDTDGEEDGYDHPSAGNLRNAYEIKAELAAYWKHKCNEDENMLINQSGLLFWWKIHQEEFRTLARVARSVLAIPASSAKSESIFSDAGNTMDDKRNRLNPHKLNDLMFLRSLLLSRESQK